MTDEQYAADMRHNDLLDAMERLTAQLVRIEVLLDKIALSLGILPEAKAR